MASPQRRGTPKGVDGVLCEFKFPMTMRQHPHYETMRLVESMFLRAREFRTDLEEFVALSIFRNDDRDLENRN